MTEDDLKKRTKQFALRILKLVAALPRTIAGRTIGGQLARSGTSVAANYRAACCARSRAEFISRLGVVEEEADESALWLELLIEGELMKKELVETLWTEADEIVAIMTSSRKSAGQSLVADQAKSRITIPKSKI
jgi:four helix bundle protein